MTDVRKGLQRRYDLETIIELHKGVPKIQGLNYDALTMLRNPLYVKMGQDLRLESQEQTQRILSHTEQANNIRQLSSNKDLPHDLLKEINTSDNNDMDTSDQPPDQPSSNNEPNINQRFQSNEEQDSPDPASKMAPNSSLFRSNIAIQAELYALRQEMQKRERHESVIQEVRNNFVQNTNPIKEIVKEIHHVIHQPPPIPVVPQTNPILIQTPVQDNTHLIQVLEQALARNQNLEHLASQMGLSLQQITQLLAHKDKPKPDEIMTSSSSSGYPPPPPPPPPMLQRTKSRSRSAIPVQQETTPSRTEPLIPKQDRSRSKQPNPIDIEIPRSKSRSIPPKPQMIDISTPVQSRAASLASTTDYRSSSRKNDPEPQERSRSRGPSFVLPIKEESSESRGRSTKTKTQEILDQMVASQNNKLMKANVKHHLGRFAQAFAAKLKEPPQKTRPLSEPPVKQTRSFDDIAEISEKDIPFGSGLQKQRVNSLGDQRRKFKGQYIK